MLLFEGAPPAHTPRHPALTRAKLLLAAMQRLHCQKNDRTVGSSHGRTNQTTLAGHLVLIGLCMQRLAGGLVSLSSLFNEELETTHPLRPPGFPRPEQRAALSSGGNQVTPGTGLSAPGSETAGLSLKQNAEKKPPQTRWLPRVKCVTFPPKDLIPAQRRPATLPRLRSTPGPSRQPADLLGSG